MRIRFVRLQEGADDLAPDKKCEPRRAKTQHGDGTLLFISPQLKGCRSFGYSIGSRAGDGGPVKVFSVTPLHFSRVLLTMETT